MRQLAIVLGTIGVVGLPATGAAQAASPPSHLEIKYVRDSEEYWTLAQQVYRVARDAVLRAREGVPRNAPWAVVLDVDETTLDNSTWELESAAYGTPFPVGWDAWVERMAAPAVPGVADFLKAVRDAGGRVAFISNRADSLAEFTRKNLETAALWRAGDRLCLETPDRSYSKAARRAELRKGSGKCAWEGQAVSVLAYVGDQMGDFPAPGEEGEGSGGLPAFGVRYFLLPQPMYGSWVSRATRPAGR